jgi:hypothetical protein
LYSADFCNREEDLKNALATSRSKVRDLEIKAREIDAGGLKLKRAMKEATNNEYVKDRYGEPERGGVNGSR